MPVLAPAAPFVIPPLVEAVAAVGAAITTIFVGHEAVKSISEARQQSQAVETKAQAEPATKVETQQRCPQKNKEKCQSLKKSIENKEKELLKRQGEMHEDQFKLPWRAPGDDVKPSLSRWGHQQIISKMKADLAADKAMYSALGCGDPYSGGDAPCPE